MQRTFRQCLIHSSLAAFIAVGAFGLFIPFPIGAHQGEQISSHDQMMHAKAGCNIGGCEQGHERCASHCVRKSSESQNDATVPNDSHAHGIFGDYHKSYPTFHHPDNQRSVVSEINPRRIHQFLKSIMKRE